LGNKYRLKKLIPALERLLITRFFEYDASWLFPATFPETRPAFAALVPWLLSCWPGNLDPAEQYSLPEAGSTWQR